MLRRGGLLILEQAAINPSERRETLYGVDSCQRMRTCKASWCLEGGIRTRRSRKLSLTLKSRAGRSCRSKVTGGAVCTALTMIATGARSLFGARQRVPATMRGIS